MRTLIATVLFSSLAFAQRKPITLDALTGGDRRDLCVVFPGGSRVPLSALPPTKPDTRFNIRRPMRRWNCA